MSGKFWKKPADLLVRFRVPLSLIIFSLLIYEDWNEGTVPQNIFDFKSVIGPLALVVILAGVLLRSWAAGIIKKTAQLATTGPYSLTRHPLYVGSFLIGIGFSLLLWDGENFLAVLGVCLLFYLPKIRQEETHLANKFGNEWQSYCHQTAMMFPKSKPTLGSFWSMKQWFYNREYNALLVSLTLLFTLAAIGVKCSS